MHVDLDAFFCSVEMLDRPELRGRPVLVGHPGRRSVVCAASYEARTFGCRSAQPMAQALARCPQAVVVTPRFERYREMSAQVMAILREYTPLVEPISVDEAFLDLSGTQRLWGAPRRVGETIRARISGECGLSASVGIAPSKLVAKLATEAAKPDGLREVADGSESEFLAPMEVGALWGVGARTRRVLHEMGIYHLRELQRVQPQELVSRLGPSAGALVALAQGIDTRTVESSHETQRMSHETTYEEDTNDIESIRASILWQCEALADRLWVSGMVARSVHLKLRNARFETKVRQRSADGVLFEAHELFVAAQELLAELFSAKVRYRLVGVAVGNLVSRAELPTRRAPPEQLGLFSSEKPSADPTVALAEATALQRVRTEIRAKFGKDALRSELVARPERKRS